MSAARARVRKPRSFSFSEFVEIDVDSEDLEAAGWVYVGEGSDSTPTERDVLDIVRLWHDDAHEGPWQWCREQPCDELRGRPQSGDFR